VRVLLSALLLSLPQEYLLAEILVEWRYKLLLVVIEPLAIRRITQGWSAIISPLTHVPQRSHY